MSEYLVKNKNGIWYIIEEDDLYQKYRKGELILNEYGDLIDSKTRRFKKKLKPKPVSPQSYLPDFEPPTDPEPYVQYIAENLQDILADVLYKVLWGCGKYCIEQYIVPLYHSAKDILTAKKLNLDSVNLQSEKRHSVVEKSNPKIKMTKETAMEKKREAFIHLIKMLECLEILKMLERLILFL